MSRGVAILGMEHGEEGVKNVLEELDEFLAVKTEHATKSLGDLFRMSFPLQQAQQIDVLSKLRTAEQRLNEHRFLCRSGVGAYAWKFRSKRYDFFTDVQALLDECQT